jgi:hypothetical protein
MAMGELTLWIWKMHVLLGSSNITSAEKMCSPVPMSE